MPIKLSSSDYRVIAIAAVVSAASLAVSVKYFWRAFPEAAIEFRVNRFDSEPIAQKYLSERGARLAGYRHAALFDFDDDAKVYLERTQGLVRMNSLTRGPVRLWRWSHRWFRPQQKEEFRVDVTPAGEVVGFDHERDESAPGANLDTASARAIAEKFLREVMKRDLTDLEFLETETEKRPARTDHSFTWKQKNVDLGDGSLRIEVGVAGDQVAGYQEFIKVPEQWSRDYQRLRSRNNAAQYVDQVFWILLTIAMLIILGQRLRDRDVPVRLSVGFSLVAAVLVFLGELNTFSLAEFHYRTTDPYSSFLAAYLGESILQGLGFGAFIFFLVAGAEPIYRENYPGLVSLRGYLKWSGLRTRSFFMANVVGIGLTFFFFAYQTVFYLVAEKFGAWAPAEVPFSNLLNTRIPWVLVLFIGFFPAVSEEMQFRAFAIPFLKKLLRSGPAAVVAAAFIWGFLHSAYPNQPFFIRGVEVGVGGIVTGLIMLRFGIMATLIWHYSVDAIYTAFLLVRSPNHYLKFSGAVTAGIMLIPMVVALVAYLRSGTFADESPLTNSSEGISRPPRREAVAEAETPLAYRPLEGSRLLAAALLIAVFGGVAFIRVYRFGEGIKLRVTRPEAVGAGDNFLKQRGVELSAYRRVAWVDKNVDALSLRYLLERRSVEESDRIYRQATHLALWHVRYYRPLQKEEHLVFVDIDTAQVFAYRHLLDENAPGASLSQENARRLAEKALVQDGFRLADFSLQNSQAQKRKARQDYTFTWQAQPQDPRNVGEAHYRLEVDVAGDQVVGVSRFFKLPEEWERQRSATRLPNILLWVARWVFILGLVGGVLTLLVTQVRRGLISWRPAAKVGAALAAVLAISQLGQLANYERRYFTSIPLGTFWIFVGVGILLVLLAIGLFAWLLVGLVTSLYPDAWRLFRSSARRAWRRDAAVAILLSIAAGAALSRVSLVISSRFHAYAPVGIDLVPEWMNTLMPGVGVFLGALLWSVIYAGLAALAVYGVRLGMSTRAWWLGLGGLLLLVSLGPARAHSVPEFFAGLAAGLLPLLVTVALVALFFRDNVLAYLGAAFALPLGEPMVVLLSQTVGFFRWNGALLALLASTILGWMLLAGEETSAAPANTTR